MNICLLIPLPMNRLTLMAFFAAIAGLYFFLHGLRLALRKRTLTRTSESTIRDACLGPAAVSGMTAGPYTLTAPVMGKPCYLYQTLVWQQTNPGRNQPWKKIAEETLHLPFFIEDSTGRLLVEPLGADLDLRADFREEYAAPSFLSEANSISPRVSIFLARHGISQGLPVRIEESIIQPETPLFVTGTLVENPGIQLRPFSTGTGGAHPPGNPTSSPRNGNSPEPAPEIIKLSGTQAPSSTRNMTQQEKIAAALNRAGVAKPEAWAAAGVSFSADASNNAGAGDRAPLAAERSTQNPRFSVSPDASAPLDSQALPALVLMKDRDNATFRISSRSKSEIEQSLGWKTAAMAIFGPALTALGLYVLLLEWHSR